MMRAWKEKFYAISQVSSTVFLAHFKSQEDMIAIYKRQPWVANSENMLVDWFDQNRIVTSSSDYKFDHVLATVRAYGIPRSCRSVDLLKKIINQIGEPSDFHILQDNNVFAKQDYMWGAAKIPVSKSVKDRVIVTYPDNTSGIAYINYEKIKRICLFCGVMFHNAQDCTIRNALITERQKSRQTSSEIPEQRYGSWMIDDSFVPEDVLQSARRGDTSNNSEGDAILKKLQLLFAEESKDKEKGDKEIMEKRDAEMVAFAHFEPTNVSHGGNALQSELMLQNEIHTKQSMITSPKEDAGRIEIGYGNQSGINQGKTQEEGRRNNEKQLSCKDRITMGTRSEGLPPVQTDNQSTNSMIPLRISAAKRAAPAAEILNQPMTKRCMQNQDIQPSIEEIYRKSVMMKDQTGPSLSQAATKVTPPFNVTFPLSAGILGAAPTPMGPVRQNISRNDRKFKRKTSRWDEVAKGTELIQNPQGLTTYTPGAVTWQRSSINANVPTSPCISDANSAMANSYDHDPWPLHTPEVSSSRGTQDSRLGAFSPPQTDRDLYVAPDNYDGHGFGVMHENIQGQVEMQQNLPQPEAVRRGQNEAKNGTEQERAVAPAFKAPWAP